MNIIRCEGHKIYSMHINRISLSPFDSKRCIGEDGIHTKGYGYTSFEIFPTLTDDELGELEAELSNLLGWYLCVWRDNQQFFAHEAALGAVAQIVENGLMRFGKRSFNTVNI